MKAARIYFMDVAEQIYHEKGEEFRGISYTVEAMCYMMPYAIKEYFLSIPNPRDVDHFDVLMEGYSETSSTSGVDTALRNKPSYDWCREVYNYCLSSLANTFSEWDVIGYRIIGNVLAMVSSGDYRIWVYTREHGVGRVETREFSKTTAEKVTSPFFVSDVVTPDMDEDVYEVSVFEDIQPLTLAHYPYKGEILGEKLITVHEEEIIDSLILKEPFDYSRIDKETEAEIKRLKSYVSKFDASKLDAKTLAEIEEVKSDLPDIAHNVKSCYDVVVARRRRMHGNAPIVIRSSWSFSAEQQRLRESRKLRSSLD